MPELTDGIVRRALATILDPELGLDLVTLGLIYDVRIDGRQVAIRLTLTTPGCPLIGTIVDDVRRAVLGIGPVDRVNVDLTFDPPWTPERMSDEAREQLGLPARKNV